MEWAGKAVDAYHRWQADAIVVETNQGGDMIATTIRTIDNRVRIKEVHAARGKQTRAEPVVALYEQNRVFHCGTFTLLEDQMASWVPHLMDSPDRVDALVWAMTDLLLGRRPAPVVAPASMERASPWRI